MLIKSLLLLTLVLQTLIHPPLNETLNPRNANAWIATFDISDETCSNRNRYHDKSSLSKGKCVFFPPGGNPSDSDTGDGNRVGGSWGELTEITAYSGTPADSGVAGACSVTDVVEWVIQRTGNEKGFCKPLSELASSYWVNVLGDGVEPQAAGAQHDSPQMSHHY